MRLKKWMTQKSINDEQLSQMLGISRPAVTMYRNDQRIPKKEIMIKLRQITKGEVSPNDFY